MPAYEWLLFDLDGTLSDPAEGFVNSMNYALLAHEYAPFPASELTPNIGPPLEVTLARLTGSENSTHIQALVDKYRERYAETGCAENSLYPGIREMLERLSQIDGIRLGVCTSKRADFAERILKQFDLNHYFEFVSGGDVGIAKWQQLHGLLENNTISSRALMIGDRHFDLTAAAKNNLTSAAVLWGYGSQEELEAHQPAYLLSHPSEVLNIV